MKKLKICLLCIVATAMLLSGCTTTQSGADAKKGAGVGAVGGGVLGLAMGAATGDAKFAVAGAAVGAAAGAAAGGMYMYDQSRDDRRTQTLADSIGGAKKGETADEAGERHLADFTGDWKLAIWYLNAEGNRVTANGDATASLTNKDKLQLVYKNIKSEVFDQVYTGTSNLTYSKEKGFSLDSTFSTTQATRTFVGEYVPANNEYNFYPSQTADGKDATGIIRTNIRIVLTASGNLAVAKTFSLVDGKEVQIQQYTFTR